MAADVLNIPLTTLDHRSITLAELPAKAYLIVNVASACGFTPQYKGLEELWQRYKDRGLQVLGFPCNQFGGQEPGSEAEIRQFCDLNYGVTFPLFAKIDVNGADAHPLYVALKSAAPGILGTEMIKWNFTKFLVNGLGEVVERYGSATKPEDIAKDIEPLLG
ncbi:MAG: glutathione peroxidase [Cellvibrionaceae bacterium]|nr:glutathione peroxidase [Cellvibrionaceae bacterium]